MKLSTFKRKFNKAHKLNYNVFVDFKNGYFYADSYNIETIQNGKGQRIFFYTLGNYIGAINLFDIEEVS